MIDNTNEIIELLENGENAELECKKSTDKLSTDIWETYSAFANTKGGSMLIGVKEKKNKFYVLNVENPKKIIKEFFDCLNNHEKVSRNIISENDVQTVEIEGKKIIIINVPRADRKQKPIYINGNPMTGTYKRNYEGDYRCTEEEINRMFAEKSDMAQDNKILEDFTLEDINYESLHSYRKRFVFARGSAHPWNDLSDEDFLYQLGCTSKKDKNHLTLAGLLMFGSEREITNILPKYFLDYREKDVSMINERWSHRIISSDGTWTGNLYDFYFKIINRLTSDLEVPFKLKNSIRNDNTPIHNAIREALTNTLVHTDFLESGSILVEKENNTFKFTNPGTLESQKREH